jgi:pilus assembly protein CpaB
MLTRLVLFVLMALGLSGFGLVAWISLRPPAEINAVQAARVVVLVTARPLRAGSLIKPEDLAGRLLSSADTPPDAKPDTPAARTELLGAMVRRSLPPGEAVLPGDVLRAGDRGFLAAVLASGMCAVTVGVDAVTGIAGLIWPGDRVDLILTQSRDDNSVPLGRRVSGETVLRDARVIAIDRQLTQGATSDNPEGQAARTVTLEVTSADAERVAVAVRLGHLSLTVRAADQPTGPPAGPPPAGSPVGMARSDPPGATASSPGTSVTWGSDVSSALQGAPASRDGATVRLFQGPTESKEIHF